MARFACSILLVASVLGSTIKGQTQVFRDAPFDGRVEQVRQLPPDVFIDLLGGNATGRAWGPEQATGPPDTPKAGDYQTAWASLTQDGSDEWLELSYDDSVVPTEVVIHESFNPGAVHKVALLLEDGDEILVWEGDDPTPKDRQMGVSKIRLDTNHRTRRIRIYLKSKEVAGWNEIDAVGLNGKDTELQWAMQAEASSTYAELRAHEPFAFNNRVTDEQVRQIVADREKQLARLIKRLRDKDKQLTRLEKVFAAEKNRLEDALRESAVANKRLKQEISQLRSQLDSIKK